jgi:outer membrane biosynthesis protein TonB
MKFASTFLLVLNLGASMASDKRLRGMREEYARQLTNLTNTTDAPTVSPAPTTYEPTKNATTVTYEPTNATASPAPTTSEPSAAPTAAPSQKPTVAPTREPSAPPTDEPTVAPQPTFYPTLNHCSVEVLVPITYWDDWLYAELPDCAREAGKLFIIEQVGFLTV